MSRSPGVHYDEIAFTDHDHIAMAGSCPVYSDGQYKDTVYAQPSASLQTDCGHQMSYDPGINPNEMDHAAHVEYQENRDSVKRSIYWVPLTMMCVSLLLGIGLAVGHHIYYSWLNGQDVGSTDSQQWSLRIGNVFAISLALCFKTAVGIAYFQYLWNTLARTSVSFKCLNDSFDVNNSLRSLVSWELIHRIRVGTMVAIVLWCLPLSTLFAPATLSVGQSQRTTFSEMQVLNMNISSQENSTNFTLPWFLDPTFNFRILYNIPTATSRVTRIISAVAHAGKRLSFELPPGLVNASYSLEANVPLVRCIEDDVSVQTELVEMFKSMPGMDVNTTSDFNGWEWRDCHIKKDCDYGTLGYVAAMKYQTPMKYKTPPNLSYNTTGVVDTDLGKEFLVAIITPQSTFLRCELYNSTLNFTVESQGGVASVVNVQRKYIEKMIVNCISNPCLSFLTFFRGLTDHIVGIIGTSSSISFNNRGFWIEGIVANTNLDLGAQWRDMVTYQNDSEYEAARAPDFVRNTTFAEDVEDFALNASLSLLNDPSLCKSVPANVTSTTLSTVYVYEPSKLLVAYGLSIFLSTISVLLGAYAIYMNGVCYDTKPTTFGIAMRDPQIRQAFESSNAAQLLDKRLEKIRVRFDPRHGFVPKPQMTNGVSGDWEAPPTDEEVKFGTRQEDTCPGYTTKATANGR